MKTLLIFLVTITTAYGQCTQDSVTDSNPATVVTLRPAPIDPCPYCDDCDTTVFVGIPADTGYVTFTNMLGVRDWRIRIINGCGGQVYVDTCIVQAANLHTVGFGGDWSHGGWLMQLCGGEIAWVTWKPGDAHGAAVIAPQPPPCGVLPFLDAAQVGVEEVGDDFPVMLMRTMEVVPYSQAPRGEVLLDWRRGRKVFRTE